jgi:hypothetical protein
LSSKVFIVLAYIIILSICTVVMARGIVGERGGGLNTEYTEWQRQLSGGHSIMQKKLAQKPNS